MSNLKKFLINKACKDETLANSLYWHVTLEKENEILILKIKELEKKLNKAEEVSTSSAKTQLNFSERENLKDQIDDLIARIDYHIRS